MNIKDMVKDGKRVTFQFYKLNELWYETECGFAFPVPIADCGDGVFLREDKAMLFMRYIRKHIATIEAARREAIAQVIAENHASGAYEASEHLTNYLDILHETGTDNPIDFPVKSPEVSLVELNTQIDAAVEENFGYSPDGEWFDELVAKRNELTQLKQ